MQGILTAVSVFALALLMIGIVLVWSDGKPCDRQGIQEGCTISSP